MLKIEVIKFEAQDVITASVAECTCPKNAVHYDWRTQTWDHGDCKAESHPHCVETIA